MPNTSPETLEIRRLVPDDVESFVKLRNRTYPTRQVMIEQVLEADAKRPAKCKSARWGAFLHDLMVGYALYVQWITDYKPGKFRVNVVVDEAFQRQGIGAKLYQHLKADLQRHHPTTLRADAYENLPGGLPFATAFGFKDVFREGPSHLDLESFDSQAFAPLVGKLESEGIGFLSFAEFKDREPQFADQLFAAYCEAWKDVPKEEETTISRSDWEEWTLVNPQIDDETQTIALSQGRIVGFCEIGKAPEGRPVYAGLAGVTPAERNRGIATALYVKAIEAAKRKGHPQMQTSSAICNIPMQTVYKRLGFVREPVWIQLEWRAPD